MVRFALIVALAALCSCGRIGFDPGDAAATDDARTGDGAPDANLSCVFHTPSAVPAAGAVSGTLGATGTTAGTCGGGGDEAVYYLDVDVAGSGMLLAIDRGSTNDNTMSLYVRRGCEEPATELACDLTDGIGNNPQVHLANLDPGRYYVFVDALTNGLFDGTLQVLLPEGAACVAGDERARCGGDLICTLGQCVKTSCTLTNTLSGAGPFNVTVDTTGSTNEHAGSCGNAFDGGLRAKERIYLLTLSSAVSDITVRTDNAATTFDTLVYVRDGCQGLEIGCDDDSGTMPNNTSIVHTGPQPAGDYYIFLDGFAYGGGTVAATITLTL